MRDAVREHFANPPPGSKLQAAINFGVDVSMMDPPGFSDRSGYRTDRSFREILNALFEHRVECIIIGGVALMLHGSTRMTADIDILYNRSRENIRRLVNAVKPFAPKLRLAQNAEPVDFPFDEYTIWNGANFALWTLDFDIDLLASTEDLPSYKAVLPESEVIETNGGRTFRILSLDALLQIKRHLNRVKDQLALPEIEALIEIRDLGRAGP
jgi:Nucleotidyltransferase of unknown function (DUF6036)